MTITVAIIEDDKHYNNALKKILDHEVGLLCVAQYFDGQSALKAMPALVPDVSIVDINLRDMSGIEVMNQLKSLHLKTQFIMCTGYEDDQNIIESLKAGASGYLLKGESIDKIISSVKEVTQGGVPMTASVARKILKQFDAPTKTSIDYGLTKTETKVIMHIAHGMSYKMVADELCISLHTVQKHIANIYKKLNVHSSIEAINKLKNR